MAVPYSTSAYPLSKVLQLKMSQRYVRDKRETQRKLIPDIATICPNLGSNLAILPGCGHTKEPAYEADNESTQGINAVRYSLWVIPAVQVVVQHAALSEHVGHGAEDDEKGRCSNSPAARENFPVQ